MQFLLGSGVNLPAIVHIDEMKGKKIGSDQDAVGEWAVAKKFEEVGCKIHERSYKKGLLT